MVGCLNCGLKIEDHSKIDLDREWEENMIVQACQHWQVFVDRCTRNTFTSFGEPDEIKYRVRPTCKGCNRSGSVESGLQVLTIQAIISKNNAVELR